MYTIQFTFEQPGITPVTVKNVEPGYSLLEIALDNKVDLHHNCGGICSCSTCHLYLEKGEQLVNEISRREKDFIQRAKNPGSRSRLACQCLLRKGVGEIEITIPDQAKFDEY